MAALKWRSSQSIWVLLHGPDLFLQKEYVETNNGVWEMSLASLIVAVKNSGINSRRPVYKVLVQVAEGFCLKNYGSVEEKKSCEAVVKESFVGCPCQLNSWFHDRNIEKNANIQCHILFSWSWRMLLWGSTFIYLFLAVRTKIGVTNLTAWKVNCVVVPQIDRLSRFRW